MSYSPFADDFLDDYNRIITLTPYATTGNGQRVMGTPHQYHARVDADSRPVYSAAATVVFSTSVVLFHPLALDGTVLTSITSDAVLQLPDGTKPRILAIGSIDDEAGVCVWECRT